MGLTIRRETVWGAAVWLVLFAAAVFLWPSSDDTEFLLQSIPSATQPLSIEGEVLHKGRLIADGKVQLVLNDVKTGQHVGSAVFSAAGGSFKSGDAFHGVARERGLHISAHVSGLAADRSVVRAHRSMYTNCSPPISARTVAHTMYFVGALGFVLIVLFTSPLTQRSGRWLLGVTYCSTLLSVTMPLAGILLVTDNAYLSEAMKESPVGLFKAKTVGVADPEWLLNIGGSVSERPSTVAAVPTSLNGTNETAISFLQSAKDGPGIVISPEVDASQSGDEPAQPADGQTVMVEGPKEPFVTGGLAIPLYVIILAMFGAGINMMRQIPRIQCKHLAELPASSQGLFFALLELPVGIAKAAVPCEKATTERTGQIQREVIEQYMCLLSAPFLAIAVYYLLQILGSSTSKPVLVLMAFSTGLISDRIVAAIVAAAKKVLGGASDEDHDRRGAHAHDSTIGHRPAHESGSRSDTGCWPRALGGLAGAKTAQCIHQQSASHEPGPTCA
jgi:hypothetical protein